MIGIIGLGLVGSAICKRFREKDFQVVGYDISPEAANQTKRLGVEISRSAEEIGLLADIVILSLPDSTQVDLVVEGHKGLLKTIAKNSLIIDTTTADPQASAKLAKRLKKRCIRFVDASIIGSSKEIENGSAVILCGGSKEDIAESKKISSVFSKQVFHMGQNGKGAETKLVANLVLGLNRLALAEGLNLGAKIGINSKLLLEILQSGAAYSRVMDHKGKRMIDAEFNPPQARLAQHHKDVTLILKLAKQNDTPTPLTTTHEKILNQALIAGLGDLDNSAVIQVLSTLMNNDL